MGQLRMNAIDAVMETSWLGLLLGLARCTRWDVTCGFCKQRFRRVQLFSLSTSVCPYCGTRNLLPVPRFPNDPGPRPPGWPPYRGR